MVKSWILLSLLCGTCCGSRILVFYPGPSGSLLRSFNVLFQELSRRGHQITLVTSYDLIGTQNHNFTQILVDNEIPDTVNGDFRRLSPITQVFAFWGRGLYDCDKVFKIPKVIELLNSNYTYDLLIASPFYYLECSVAVAHHLKLPILNIFPNRMSIQFSHLVGSLYPYTYVTEYGLPFSSNMNFWQRMLNTMFCLGYSLGLSVYYIPRINSIVKQHFPHAPPLEDMLSQIPVTLLNTNIAVHPAQPLLPGIIPVGGLTVTQTTKLPEDLEIWMNESEQGVILFSLGSNIKMTMLDPKKIQVILAVFGGLQQRVLMKWEADDLDGKPDNVRVAKWVPQTAVLAHPNCRLLITHGGLHSWMEAVRHSVPLLGMMPLFLDQFHNLQEMQERGHGIYFSGPWIQENLHGAILEILHNSKYKENIHKASRVFWDQPLSPLETAVYWTEYVIRHKGAPHLQSATSTMPWYQVVLLDVIAFLIVCVIVAMISIWAVLRILKRCLINYKYIISNRTIRVCDKLKKK